MSKALDTAAREAMEIDYKGDEIECSDSWEAKIRAIDPNISAVDRAKKLKHILQALASLDVSYGDALVNHTMKEHFGLPDKKIKPYLIDLNNYRKMARKPDKEQTPVLSPSRDQLIEQLKSETNIVAVNPAQDFYNSEMYFAIKIKGQPYLLSSERELISFFFSL